MGKPGIMIDPNLEHRAEHVPPGVHWVRLTLRPDRDDNALIDEIHGAGGEVLAVLDKAAFGPDWKPGWEEADYRTVLDVYATTYVDKLDALEAGNEPDNASLDAESLSSSKMSAATVSRMINAAIDAFPTTRLVIGGQVSGQIEWVETLLRALPKGVIQQLGLGIHPYTKLPQGLPGAENPDTSLGGALDTFGSLHRRDEVIQLPLWITEIGVQSEGDEAGQAEYLELTLREALPRCEAVVWFALHDFRDEISAKTFGVRRLADFSPKPSFDVFEQFA